MTIYPFRDGDTFSTFRNKLNKVLQEVNSLDNDYVLNASITELEDYFLDKVKIEPLELFMDDYYIENQTGAKIDVSNDFDRVAPRGERIIVQGTRLDIAIPYRGDKLLWRVGPSSFSFTGYPDIDIRDDSILIWFTFADDSADSDKIKTEIDRLVNSLSKTVLSIKRDVENHNNTAPQKIKEALESKREKAFSATNAVATLGIPIKRSNETPTFSVPSVRRKISVKPPTVPTDKYKPEPVLDNEEYDHILNVIRSMSLVIERSPTAFKTMDEESIRDHFLIQLNGHYEGGATGETFNASGKTDILIRVENRNIFIAECKFWRGPKVFNEAIDQLLGYLSWRDTKSALLIFNKTKSSSSVRQKMHEIMTGRSEHRRSASFDPEGDARYIFIKESDPGREIIITTQLYDMPTT